MTSRAIAKTSGRTTSSSTQPSGVNSFGREPATAAAGVGGKVLADDELLDEVTQLVEFPQPLVGQFEDKYLELPPELLITVIKKHQRYFAVTDGAGALLPYFVTISNTVPRDFALVEAGNARVVRARLEDARFYYREDQKVPLDDRVEQLKGVVFHSKIGTSYEKMERFSELAMMLAERVAPERVVEVRRAASLCKADLVSGVVSEFPELQGIMGRTYARLQGEPEAVAEAIYEHYLPNRSGGPVPSRIEGSLISIADKIDTIAACFGVGRFPRDGRPVCPEAPDAWNHTNRARNASANFARPDHRQGARIAFQ